MLDILGLLGFVLLFARYSYWLGSSLLKSESYTGRVFLSQFAEGVLLFFFFSQFFGILSYFPMPPFAGFRILGFFLVLVGVAMCFLAKQQLGEAWVYASAYKKSTGNLVTGGLYKFIRHPIYTGIVVSYVGMELLAGSWLWVSMLFFVVPFYFQAKKEEKFLEKKFGQKYREYVGETKMFVPGLI